MIDRLDPRTEAWSRSWSSGCACSSVNSGSPAQNTMPNTHTLSVGANFNYLCSLSGHMRRNSTARAACHYPAMVKSIITQLLAQKLNGFPADLRWLELFGTQKSSILHKILLVPERGTVENTPKCCDRLKMTPTQVCVSSKFIQPQLSFNIAA